MHPRYNLKLLLILSFCIFVPIAWGQDLQSVKPVCIRSTELTELLQSEILAAQQLYLADSSSKYARTSNKLEGRALKFDQDTIPTGSVVSLGSGADVFLPLYEFPWVENIHLVDKGAGWGEGVESIISEVPLRLKAIHPSAEVFETSMIENLEIVWKVSWVSPSVGKVTRNVFLHVLDFNDVEKFDLFLDSPLFEASNKISGILNTGVYVSTGQMKKIYARLAKGGVLHAELQYKNLEGEISEPDSIHTLRYFEARKRHVRVEEFGKPTFEPEFKFFFIPTRYLFWKLH